MKKINRLFVIIAIKCLFIHGGIFAQVGIGTSSPTALLHVEGTGTGEGNVLFKGNFKGGTSGLPPVSGPGTRLMWYPDKAAIRAGGIDGTQWNQNEIGIYSTAFGYNNRASGPYSTAFGINNIASGEHCTAWGSGSIASGSYSTAGGTGLYALSAYEIVLGTYNNDNSPFGYFYWDELDRLFVIGNGTSSNSRSDALVILKNGKAGFGNANNPQYQISLVDNGVGLDRPAANNLAFYTNSAERMRITSPGDVGVGTDNPDARLEIRGSGIQSARIRSTGSSDVYLDLMRSGSDWRIRNSGGILLFGQSDNDYTTVTDVLRLGGGSAGPAADNTISSGTASLRWNTVFAVNGTINTSDARDKKDVRDLSYGMEQIMQLRPVSFEWKNSTEEDRKLGLIAQDLQTVLPEVVRDWDLAYDEDGGGPPKKVPAEHLGVFYSDLIPVLIKGMQEQQLVIDELKARIESLEAGR